MAADSKSKLDPWRLNEESRRRQVLEDAKRPLAVNLAEGLALSEFLSTFTGAARRAESAQRELDDER
ncbi:MAG TPA: hypothetical protein VF245_00085 [Solirubrobacterales bacterium]